jgi:hypothetical protein
MGIKRATVHVDKVKALARAQAALGVHSGPSRGPSTWGDWKLSPHVNTDTQCHIPEDRNLRTVDVYCIKSMEALEFLI